MSFKQHIALSMTPMWLRVAIGLTFLWAGAGKLLVHVPFQGEPAARLANMGVAITPTASPAAPATDTAPAATPPAPTISPPSQPLPEPSADRTGPRSTNSPAKAPSKAPPRRNLPTASAETENLLPDGPIPAARPTTKPAPSSSPAAQPTASPSAIYLARDFPTPVTLRRVYGLALAIDDDARVPANAKNPMALFPPSLATGSWPIRWAWLVAITELFCGAAVLAGLLTRLSALALAGVMVGALWLDRIGPALIREAAIFGGAEADAWWNPAAWGPMWWQFGLVLCCMALVTSGPGPVSLDAFVLAPSKKKEEKPA
ncbi:MAG: DoxX family membrane protein [Planctomyces sp.]